MHRHQHVREKLLNAVLDPTVRMLSYSFMMRVFFTQMMTEAGCGEKKISNQLNQSGRIMVSNFVDKYNGLLILKSFKEVSYNK